jgi:triosephosphate isomerase
MDRRPIIAANWKMNLLKEDAEALAKGLLAGLDGSEQLDVVVAPPFPYLSDVARVISGSAIDLAAQNLHWEGFGAYTGEVCAPMLRDVGCRYVIVGHSERRQYFHETDETVNKRLKAGLAGGLIPIFCVGETLEERKGGRMESVVERQVREGLAGISSDDFAEMVIAYEPVWAIGTGETATPEQAQAVHAHIRNLLKTLYGDALAAGTRIQYGGSVKPGNAAELMGKSDIDGALVGGAALKADSFLGIIHYGS